MCSIAARCDSDYMTDFVHSLLSLVTVLENDWVVSIYPDGSLSFSLPPPLL
jgi:hypothetical protein